MNLLLPALRAGHGPARRPAHPAQRVALVAGAAGSLGSAVLEQALASGAFARVQVLVTSPVAAAVRGFESLTLAQLAAATSAPADTAFIVFDRERHANGRDGAFLRPQPADLPALAEALRQAGVQRLLVVLPHAPAGLPQALRQGLASLDEHAVAALGFEQAVFVRSAQAAAPQHGPRLQGLAHWMLRQLHLMLPQQEQPVRGPKVAAFVVQLARALPQASAGTRVVPPEVVWQAAQHPDSTAVAQAWLQGQPLPPLPTLRRPRY
ncbi:hypothetical protein [Eleftheria terrae]|uniref:hypothetical protein n=1 Tax=Eleftheria terrae TaxID=1597781 RepID=UPI00263B2C26|nr:hypothetical protein [Eleftheria terrae]WKB52591.1 hypothetical protein N7L95_22845 [Eleftheria terrae]